MNRIKKKGKMSLSRDESPKNKNGYQNE